MSDEFANMFQHHKADLHTHVDESKSIKKHVFTVTVSLLVAKLV